jgi:cytochrome c oxidase assembly protein subunit 15
MLTLISMQLGLLIRRDCKFAGSFQSKVLTGLIAVAVYQAVIGVAQARMGVPPLLVGLHMLGAASLCSLLTFQWLVVRGKPSVSADV